MKELIPHRSNDPVTTKIFVEMSISKDMLKIMFQIQDYLTPKMPLHSFQEAYKNWGLWDYDVVEFFFRPKGATAYYEIQVSFNNKNFQLEIFKPRIHFFTPFDFKFESIVEKKDGKWVFNISIPNIWKTEKFEGNCFSILSDSNRRLYFALNPNLEDKPDFHRTDLFMELK